MESYYPHPEVAIGGLVGLALFFMATGMGISASRNTRSLSFAKWFGMRILRIHPSVITSTVLIQLLLFGMWREWDWTELSFANPYVDNLFYPLSTYHFLNKIFVFYVPLYFYVRCPWKRKHLVGIGGCCLLCLVTAIPDIQKQAMLESPLRTGFLNEPFLWSIFFFMTILGVWISDCPALFRKRPLWPSIAVTVMLGGLYLGCKYSMAKLGIFTEGFILLYACGILLAIALVVVLTDRRLLDCCKQSNQIIRWATIGIGTISLEIYLVHTQFYMNRVGQSLSFPLNFLTFAIASIAASIVVHWAAAQFRSLIQGSLRPKTIKEV